MTVNLSPPSAKRRAPRRNPGSRSQHGRAGGARSGRAQDARTPPADPARKPLGSYTDAQGRAREVVTREGAAGSVLVVDRDSATRADCRLIAHLAADEPAGNAALVCRRYIEDIGTRPCRCRQLDARDARSDPLAELVRDEPCAAPAAGSEAPLVDRLGRRYRLERVNSGMSIPELRWCRFDRQPAPEGGMPVSTREAIAALESYEPVRAQTLRAVSGSRSPYLSTTVLRAELVRVLESPIVLNRGLREAVLLRLARHELSMSEIALRCGRVKRDRRAGVTGETSWLARRIGLLAEGGHAAPTPWVHTDVLALIARRGLGISPREVEL